MCTSPLISSLKTLEKMNLNLKDPIFTIHQTDSIILTSHLKEYRKEDIKIEINEDGSRITISGEQAEKMRGFRKTFKIPEGVVLDKVKARFDQDESRLTIRMPKPVKELTGIGIQGSEDAGKGDDTSSNHREEDAMSNGTIIKDNNITQSENQEPDHENEKHVQKTEEENVTRESKPSTNNLSTPILAGSGLLASLIVVAFNMFRSRHESNQKRQ